MPSIKSYKRRASRARRESRDLEAQLEKITPSNSVITRVELIDYYNNKGRAFVFWKNDASIEYQLQDGGRTLKVFINKKY